jgi:hypothetical protein
MKPEKKIKANLNENKKKYYQGGRKEFSMANQRGGKTTKSATAVPAELDWQVKTV